MLIFHRFLWVFLQLDCLCKNDMGTDDSIRRSLQDMPRDLYTLFSRILQMAKVTGPAFQSRLLKVLVAAQCPLTLTEMREALSIVPADAVWRPQQQINNIAHALASCGSLVTIDEEEGTVRFVHQSVSQFLLQGADNEVPLDWHFTFHQASLELGQLLVTYLSYGVFDQQLSTTVVPNILAGQAPTAIVQHVLKDGPWRKAAALKLLRLRSHRDPDLGRTITEVSGAYQRRSENQGVFNLLAYAREYWLLHTRTISSESMTYSLWRNLLTHPIFGQELHMASRGFSKTTPDGSHEATSGASSTASIGIFMKRWVSLTEKDRRQTWHGPPLPRLDLKYWTNVYDAQERYIVCEFHPVIIWIITNSHLGLLSIELRGRHGIRALCSVVVYLLALQKTDVRPQLGRPMWAKLGQIANALKMENLADDISQFCNEGNGRLALQHTLQELHLVERESMSQAKYSREIVHQRRGAISA